MTQAQVRTQARALLWEEARVGGLIACVTSAVGLLMLVQTFLVYGESGWVHDEFLTRFAAVGVPLITTFLIVLNPDHSGHLVGGFSGRILRLPVPTWAAVSVTLSARTFFVFACSAMLFASSTYVFDRSHPIAGVSVILLVYFLAQCIDWLRGVVRGLTTLALFGVVALLIYWIWPGSPGVPIFEWASRLAVRSPVALPALVAVAFAATWSASLGIARLHRIGRRFGVAEIWEWPVLSSRAHVHPKSPFATPLAAQVWFEFRRSWWVLPFVTVLSLFVSSGVVWVISADSQDPKTVVESVRTASVFAIFLGVLLGAAAHGIRSRVVGLRHRRGRTPGYEYLLPLRDVDFAMGRVIVGTLVLTPTILAALILHVMLTMPYVVADLMPTAIRGGYASLREVVWMLFGRGLLVALVAWPLLALGTRMFRRTFATVALVVVAGICVALFRGDSLLTYDPFQDNSLFLRSLVPLTAVLAIAPLLAAALAWRRGLLTLRVLIGGLCAWVSVAWLLGFVVADYYATMPATSPAGLGAAGPVVDLRTIIGAITVAFGFSASIPLVFLALLFDIRRKRSDRPELDREPHAHGRRLLRPRVMLPAAVAALLVLWLGWPATPSALSYLRDRGYPGTLGELDAWYAEPTPGANAADTYLATVEKEENLVAQLNANLNDLARALSGVTTLDVPESYDGWNYTGFWDSPFIVGNGELSRAQRLDKRSWEATEVYWSRVTSGVMPALREISAADTSLARYPVDLNKGIYVELPHLARMRQLARECSIDALHWTIAGDLPKAVESIEAGFALSKSLTEEPILISQLVRLASLGINVAAVETMMNRSVPDDAALLRLQRACDAAYPAPAEGMGLDRSIVGEAVISLGSSYLYGPDGEFNEEKQRVSIPLMLANRLAFPLPATRTALISELNRTRDASAVEWSVTSRASDGPDYEARFAQLGILSPQVVVAWPSLNRSYDAEIRVRQQLALAATAIAVDRHRTARGELPPTLDALVPDFVSQVPTDYFDPAQGPIRYRVADDGTYSVYSVGRNGIDNGGMDATDWWKGDITFLVAPLSVRSAPQISDTYGPILPLGGGLLD